MLHTLLYRHFREAPCHVDFPEKVWSCFPVIVLCRPFLAYMQRFQVTLLKTRFINFVFPFVRLTPGPFLGNLVCHSFTGVNFIFPMWILS